MNNQKQNLKLIDVKTDFNSIFICSNCGRKLKNAYVLNSGDVLGSECIIKVLGDDLNISEDIKGLNSKLKKIKYILNKCSFIRISGEVEKNKNNSEYKTYFYLWLYDDLNQIPFKNNSNLNNFSSFKYRITLKDYEKLKPYFLKNKNIKYYIDDDNDNLKEVLK